MHLRVDGCSSHRETPSAALLRCCCRATHANLDPARTCPIHGRHQWRMARSVANVQRAHSLRAPGSSLWSGLRCGAEASTSDGLFPLTGADPLVDSDGLSPFHFHIQFHFHFLSFRQRNQCIWERWDRILAQVTFLNEVPCPPALRFTISWRTGGLSYCIFVRFIYSF